MDLLGPIEILFLLAPLAVVPLGLHLIEGPRAPATPALSAARRVLAPAVLAVVASFFTPRGPGAAALALPWLALTGLVAFHGLALFRRQVSRAVEAAVASGCLMLPVGGGWLVLSRWGATPLGFEEPIVLLTAVHFHYAAFGALVLTGLAGRVVDGRVYAAVVAGAVAGPPLLAAGITLSPALEMAAASLLVASLSGLAVLTLLRIVPRLAGPSRLLLAISSLSLLAGMALALAWAAGEFTGVGLVSLGQMARIHGPLNAVGFVLCGLLGWRLALRNLPPPSL